MHQSIRSKIVHGLDVGSIHLEEVIQELWSGYGSLCRYRAEGEKLSSIIVKQIDLNSQLTHPKGWNTAASHQRKIKSYEIERQWYVHWAHRCDQFSRVPKLLLHLASDESLYLVLEDLDANGYPLRLDQLTLNEVELTLSWLAHFHATFMGEHPNHLWKEGSYWHLNSRKEEWQTMAKGELKANASNIDHQLTATKYRTVIHGDAKLANFCFSSERDQIAAVDFQYVGGGCGMKDVAYFLSSAMDADALFAHDTELLECYFTTLASALKSRGKSLDFPELKSEWIRLYPFAWADFSRFLEGWSPEHRKLHPYSRSMVKKVLATIEEDA